MEAFALYSEKLSGQKIILSSFGVAATNLGTCKSQPFKPRKKKKKKKKVQEINVQPAC